jgi:uncharacterized protein
MQNSALESPCDGNCNIDSQTQLCIGCFRTIDEIISWYMATDEQKKIVMDKVKNRKSSMQEDDKS